MAKGEIRHGTLTGYRHYKCRCDECSAANTRAVKDWRRRAGPMPRPVVLPMPEEDE